MFSSLSLILDGTLAATLGIQAAPGNGIPQSDTLKAATAAMMKGKKTRRRKRCAY
jgi:hypothetical protein